MRARPGTYVTYTNGYFTFTYHPAYQDIKVRVVPCWCKPGLLGTSNMSKSLSLKDVGATKADPSRAVLVLKAWMLNKAQENDFCNKVAARRRLFTNELEDLRRAVAAMSPGGSMTTGHPKADQLIQQWAPAVWA